MKALGGNGWWSHRNIPLSPPTKAPLYVSRAPEQSTAEEHEHGVPDAATIVMMPEEAIEFQIRATVHSWSFAWNRGDIVGYCDSYSDTAPRYVSINSKGRMTILQGKENIARFFTDIFEKGQKYQMKLEQLHRERDVTTTSMNLSKGAAGYIEYNNLQIQVLNEGTSAIVFGEYRLEYSSTKHERGVFTLHLIQTLGIWRIQSEHSSAILETTLA